MNSCLRSTHVNVKEWSVDPQFHVFLHLQEIRHGTWGYIISPYTIINSKKWVLTSSTTSIASAILFSIFFTQKVFGTQDQLKTASDECHAGAFLIYTPLGSSLCGSWWKRGYPLSPRSLYPRDVHVTPSVIGSRKDYIESRTSWIVTLSVMATRQSRRLYGLMPEEQILDQVCFICQGSIHIGSLRRCVKTACCDVFMHKRCHCEMVTHVQRCGNCQCDNPEYVREIVMETEEEMSDGEVSDGSDNPFDLPTGTPPGFHQLTLRQELNRYWEENRHHNTHFEGSIYWNDLPYNINSFVWCRYYSLPNDFVEHARRRAYLHRCVLLPVDPTPIHRVVVYRRSCTTHPSRFSRLITILTPFYERWVTQWHFDSIC